MKKRIMMLLFIFVIFMVGFYSVKADDINITCGDSKCGVYSFNLYQLTPSNTGSSSTFIDYADYVKDYYQNDFACGWQTRYSYCTDLSNGFEFFSTSEVFDFYENGGFHNLSDFIGTSKSYEKAGTYVFLLKTNPNKGTAQPNKTEYIIYINVKSDLTIGTTYAMRIKDGNGSVLNSPDKVTSLTYSAVNVYPVTFTYNGGSVQADYYCKNEITGEYADLSRTVLYHFSIPELDKIVEAILYDKNGCVKTNNVCTKITFTESEKSKDVILKDGEALVFPKGSLKLGYTMWNNTYNGLSGEGYKLKKSYYTNGILSTHESAGSLDGPVLGGLGANYTVYTWTYNDSDVPSTGVIIKILPYAIIIGLVLISVVLFLLLTNKRKKTETTK